MSCCICREDLDIDDVESFVSCRNHCAHVSCYSSWQQSRTKFGKIDYTCVLCRSLLSDYEVSKIEKARLGDEEIIRTAVKNSDLDVLKWGFEVKVAVSEALFQSLVHEALEVGNYEILGYLKPCERIYTNDFNHRDLTRHAFQLMTEAGLRYISNSFDMSLEAFGHAGILKVEHLKHFSAGQTYRELFWILNNFFPLMENSARLEATWMIYNALVNGMLEDDFLRTQKKNYSWLFVNLCLANPHQSCYILGQLAPLVLMRELHDWDSFRRSLMIQTIINFCLKPCCRGLHLWDCIVVAVKENNDALLRAFLGLAPRYPIKSKQLKALAKALAASNKPEYFKKILHHDGLLSKSSRFSFYFRYYRYYSIFAQISKPVNM